MVFFGEEMRFLAKWHFSCEKVWFDDKFWILSLKVFFLCTYLTPYLFCIKIQRHDDVCYDIYLYFGMGANQLAHKPAQTLTLSKLFELIIVTSNNLENFHTQFIRARIEFDLVITFCKSSKYSSSFPLTKTLQNFNVIIFFCQNCTH